MNGIDLITQNHDLHMHSLDFSDGKHPVGDVIRFAARWQRSPRWIGLSDHNPADERMVEKYLSEVKRINRELTILDGIEVLAGMELEWNENGPALNGPILSKSDYCLAGYHEMKFTDAAQVEDYFRSVSNFQYSDIVAHPDRFLGSVDALTVNWYGIFHEFENRSVACEYNLTTPLRSEIFSIAMKETDVSFIIGSDTHDFRNIGVRRIIDAWSESLGGGFELAYHYLVALLKFEYCGARVQRLSRLFDSRDQLDRFQHKLFLRTLKGAQDIQLQEDEQEVVSALERIPEGEEDRTFFVKRLDRFNAMPSERIISLLPCDQFRERIRQGRIRRA